MTIAELIEKLQAMPQDLEVCYWDDEYGFNEVTAVFETADKGLGSKRIVQLQ